MNMPFVNGSHLLLESGAHGLTGFFDVRLPDYEEAAFASHLLRPSEEFADVGANASAWSIMGAQAEVDAFDPMASHSVRLVKNVEGNALENGISIHDVGIGSQMEKLVFITAQGTEIRVASSEDASGEPLEVSVKTLDQALPERRPVLIKIDVEGWELQVIKGARILLQRLSMFVRVSEAFREQELSTPMPWKMEALLAAHGFQLYAYHPFQRRLGTLDGKARSTGNALYVRDIEAVQVRLRNADALPMLEQKV